MSLCVVVIQNIYKTEYRMESYALHMGMKLALSVLIVADCCWIVITLTSREEWVGIDTNHNNLEIMFQAYEKYKPDDHPL